MPQRDPIIRQASQKAIRVRNIAFVKEFLSKNPCVGCGESDVVVLDFDHIDPKTKSLGISRMSASMHFSLDRIRAEMAKCQVLCANCHRRKTHKERQDNPSGRFK